MTIYSEADLKQAIIKKESPIVVEDKTIGNAFLVAGRIQGGLLPKVVLKRIQEGGTCQVSVGEGVVIPVTKGLASTISELLEVLEDEEIEIDVEEVAGRKINLYYNNRQ